MSREKENYLQEILNSKQQEPPAFLPMQRVLSAPKIETSCVKPAETIIGFGPTQVHYDQDGNLIAKPASPRIR